MKKRNRMLSCVWRGQWIVMSLILLGAVSTSAKSPAKPHRLKRETVSPKYKIATGSDQVLSAVYDANTNSLRVEGAISGSGSTGTVTSVGLSLPSIFTVSGSPVTTSGTLAATLASQTQNLFLASPNGAAGAPSFRALNIADLPAISFANITGQLADWQMAPGAVMDAGVITAGDCAKWISNGLIGDAGAACGSGSASGTVTSVGLSLPSIFTVSGSPVTTTGMLAATLASQGANLVLASPNGAAGAPAFRALNIADLPALNFTNLAGTLSDSQLPADAARFTGTITAGDCAKWSSSGVVTDAGAACGSGSGSTVIQVNGVATTLQSPINFQSGSYITVSNPGQGNIQVGFSGILAPSNGGTGLTTLGTNGQCLGTNGTVMQWQACGAGGVFTAAGDLSGTSTSQTVIGLQGKSLAAPSTPSTFLEYNGTGYVWASGTGATNPGGASTQVQFNNSGAFGGSSNLTWNNATDTLTVNGTISATAVQTAGNSLVLNTAACLPGPGATSAFCSNTGNVPSISVNGGTVTPIAPLIGDLAGSWTAVNVQSFHLAGDGNTQNNAVITQIANETTSNTVGMTQTYNASGNGSVVTYTVVSGFQPFQVGDLVSVISCPAQFDGGSMPVTAATSTTFTVNLAGSGSGTGCVATAPSGSTRSSGVVTMRIFPEPFSAGEAVMIAGCSDTSFQSVSPQTITAVATGSITYTLAGAGTSTTNCTASSGTKNGYLAKATPSGARFATTADTGVQTFVVASGGGVSGDAHFANAGQAQCVMDASASNTEGEAVIASTSADSECTPTSSPGSAFVVGYMISNSTTAGSAATVGVGTGYLSGSSGSVAGVTNPMTAAGDIIVGGSGGTPTRLALGSNGQCLTSNGATDVWASCSGASGTTPWSSITNATANLAISNGTFTSTFNQTSAANWTWANTTAATSSASQPSPIFNLCGQGWEGATPANTQDCWQIQQVIPNGPNTVPVLNLTESGASTGVTASQPAMVEVPELETPIVSSLSSSNLSFRVPGSGSFGFDVSGGDVIDVALSGASDIALYPSGTCHAPASGDDILCANTTGNILQLSNNGAPSMDVATNGVNSIAYSTTPALDLSKGNVQQFSCTTAGAAIAPTTSNLRAGERMQFIFIQNGTTACTLTWPSTIHGGGTVGTTLGGINVQSFVVSHNGTDLYATAAMVANMTGGTP